MPPDFDSLIEAHSAEIFAYLWRLTRDEPDAQDCLQDTFLRAYRAYGGLQSKANLRAWLYRIASNVAFTHLKRRRKRLERTTPLDPEQAGAGPGPGEALLRSEALHALAEAVERLPEQQRAALILRKYQELSYPEIAAALDCTQSAARANVYQAVKKLRISLDGIEW
jgi:RNA polymerase sigma-70 factor (ECF subfamily)